MVKRYTVGVALTILAAGAFVQGEKGTNALSAVSRFYHADGPATG